MLCLLPSPVLATSCASHDLLGNGCPSINADSRGDRVDLAGRVETGDGNSRSGGNGDEEQAAGQRRPDCEIVYGVSYEPCIITSSRPEEGSGSAPLTIEDLASFRPDAPVQHMQPDGWMIVGLDTNFYAPAGQQVHHGTLLGSPASVRFTPIAWHWQYGDGHSRTAYTGGATWEQLGLPEFDPTPTSHAYETTGTYTIDLAVEFRAEYRFADSNWSPVAGTVTVPSNRLQASAGTVKTVLVAEDCNQNPDGPGC